MSNPLKIDQLCALIDTIRDVESEFPPQSIKILLLVAKTDRAMLVDIARLVGLTPGAVSRNMQKLAVNFNGVTGLGFLEVNFVEGNYRQKEAKLTPKGERFVQKLSDCI